MKFNHNKDNVCQRYLQTVYEYAHIRSEESIKQNNIPETDGEILFPSVNKLLEIMALKADDSFIDLGSGAGKVVAQVFLQSGVKEAYGIELLPALYQQAVVAAEKIQQDLSAFYQEGRKLTFLQGDFLEMPLPQATVVLICSTCFSQPMLESLGYIINGMPSVRLILTLRPISTLNRLRFKKTVRIECSWDSALCYIYC
jgi:hypothetical protein